MANESYGGYIDAIRLAAKRTKAPYHGRESEPAGPPQAGRIAAHQVPRDGDARALFRRDGRRETA